LTGATNPASAGYPTIFVNDLTVKLSACPVGRWETGRRARPDGVRTDGVTGVAARESELVAAAEDARIVVVDGGGVVFMESTQ